MSSKKKKGFFGKLLGGTNKEEVNCEEGESTSRPPLEIPIIRADDAGAAIDDFQCSPPVNEVESVPTTTTPTTLVEGTTEPAAGDVKVRFSSERHLSTCGLDDDDDDELSESLDVMMRRRESGRRRSMVRRSPVRRSGGGSPSALDADRRRSSTMTSISCEETQISMEVPELTEEQLFENIKIHKELVDSVKKQPWKMSKRLKIVRKAKVYVRKHEGLLEQRLAQSKNTKDVMARYSLIYFRYWERIKRHGENLAKSMIPWEMRIKRIESHFGSAVASYFVFLRWIFWINIVMSIFISCFVIIPEVLAADRSSAGDRKELLPGEEAKAFNLQTLWDFEGFLRYSPIFYGYYTNKDKTGQGYRIPFAYFMTLLGVYGYSFAAILQRMAENTRQSKLEDKEEDCTFTWKLFTSWDYMIGNSETADNKVASILMGFKENILEEREKSKEERNWKIWALRVLANVLVLILLVSSAYAVVLVVQRSREPEADDSWWRQNEATVIISLISLLYPNLFDLIGLLENNHPRTQLRFQLARIMILYLLNLYTLIFSLFSKVDEMSAALKVLKPNLTTVPAMSPTPAVTILDQYPPVFGLFPIMVNGTSAPFWNTTSDGYQIPLPGTFVTQIMEMLNLSLYWNDTCLVARVPCDVNEFSSPTTTPGPEWNYGRFGTSLLGVLNSSYLALPRPLSLLANVTDANSNSSEDSEPSPANLLFRSTSPKYQTTKKRPLTSAFTTEQTKRWRNREEKSQTMSVPNYQTTKKFRSVWWDGNRFTSTSTSWPRHPWWSGPTEAPSTPHPTNVFSKTFTIAPGYCVAFRCMNLMALTPTPAVDDDHNFHWYTSTTGRNELTEDAECLNATTSTSVTDSQGLNRTVRENLRRLCWETMFGQDLVKLTIMDLVMTVISIMITDFFRALIVRVMNHCCCWDLEKQFPGYGDFKIAENILHLVNNQGMIWMGMFFAPGIPGINMVKLVLIMYIRSWAVLVCNIPHETVFKASNSTNFYYVLLLTMLFLCTLPVGYAIVWLEPSWHCGPFSQYLKIYRIFTSSVESILPDIIIRGLGYAASPGIIIPLLVLLLLIIYYLNSVGNSLREANKDLKTQLRRERTEERRKVFQMADSRMDSNNGETDGDHTKDADDYTDLIAVDAIKTTNGNKILAGVHISMKTENGEPNDKEKKINSKNKENSNRDPDFLKN